MQTRRDLDRHGGVNLTEERLGPACRAAPSGHGSHRDAGPNRWHPLARGKQRDEEGFGLLINAGVLAGTRAGDVEFAAGDVRCHPCAGTRIAGIVLIPLILNPVRD